MTVDVASASQTSPVRAATEQDRDILYLIGRALIDHKDRLYMCHRTGFTAELAWPIMEAILANIRPYLKSESADADGVKLLPVEPTGEMTRAALQASLLVQQFHGGNIQPDSPGAAPSDMVRAVWTAMLHALPVSPAVLPSTICPPEPLKLACVVDSPRSGSLPCLVGYGDQASRQQPLAVLLLRAGQTLKSRTLSLLSAAGRSWHTSKQIVARN